MVVLYFPTSSFYGISVLAAYLKLDDCFLCVYGFSIMGLVLRLCCHHTQTHRPSFNVLVASVETEIFITSHLGGI